MTDILKRMEEKSSNFNDEWTVTTEFNIIGFEIRKIIHASYEKGDDWYPGNKYIDEVYYAIFCKDEKRYVDFLYATLKEAKWDLQRIQNCLGFMKYNVTDEVKEE